MPVTRELINRIAFKVNSADVAKAQNSMKGMQEEGKKTIGVVSGIGGMFKKAGLAAVAFGVASTKVFTEFEQNTGVANFFARNAEEAQKVIAALDEIAEKSETTSEREARRAAQTLLSTGATRSQIEELLPFIEKLSIARPDLDFTQVSESLRQVITDGSLQELQNLIPGIRLELEALSKTTFGKPFGELFAEQRAELVLQRLIEAQGRIDQLVREQQETLNITFVQLAKETSDFTKDFGEKTAPLIKDVVVAIKDMLKELNDSESFWETVENSVTGIRDFLGIRTDVEPEFDSSRLLGVGDFLATGIENLTSQFGIQSGVRAAQREFAPQQYEINIGGEVKVTGQNLNGVDLTRSQQNINDVISEAFTRPMRNLIAQNGGLVATGPR